MANEGCRGLGKNIIFNIYTYIHMRVRELEVKTRHVWCSTKTIYKYIYMVCANMYYFVCNILKK